MRVELLDGTQLPERVVCRAARGDYSAEWVGSDREFAEVMESVDGDTLEEKKRTLIDHLMRSGHWGPFEHPSATFAVEGVSRACMAQLTRHRHASFDVQSMRYVDFSTDDQADLADTFAFPDSFTDDQAISREGVEDIDKPASVRTAMAKETFERCLSNYEQMVEAGVPKEDARMLLPIGTKVNLTFTMNARSLMHLLDMRLKADAQWEIRELSEGVLEECKEWMSYTFEKYEDEHPNKLAP